MFVLDLEAQLEPDKHNPGFPAQSTPPEFVAIDIDKEMTGEEKSAFPVKSTKPDSFVVDIEVQSLNHCSISKYNIRDRSCNFLIYLFMLSSFYLNPS